MNQSRYISATVPIIGTKDGKYSVGELNAMEGTDKLFDLFREGFEIKLSHVIEATDGVLLYVILEKRAE